jgi:hypothetical protein
MAGGCNMRKLKKILSYSFLGSLRVGIIVGVGTIYIAWDHNAQDKIHADFEVFWGYWFSIAFIYFNVVFSILFFCQGFWR